MSHSPIFTGNAHIYLQGEKALLPIALSQDEITYYIGEEYTNLVLVDHRYQSVTAANTAITTNNVTSFPYIFNQPANIVINKDKEIITIDLFEGTANESNPMLWIGVINDNHIPIHLMIWQKFISLKDEGIAFAALISD